MQRNLNARIHTRTHLQLHDEYVFLLRLKVVFQLNDAWVPRQLIQDVDLSQNANLVNLSLLHHLDGVVDSVTFVCAFEHFTVGSAGRENCGKTLSQ